MTTNQRPEFDFDALLDSAKFEPLLAEEIRLGETRFYFSELRATENKPMLDQILHEVTSTNFAGIDPTVDWRQTAIRLIGGFSPAFVQRLEAHLYRSVDFSRAGTTTRQQLAGAKDMAFDGLSPFDMYEVTARAFAVNFLRSLKGFLSRHGVDLDQILPRQSSST